MRRRAPQRPATSSGLPPRLAHCYVEDWIDGATIDAVLRHGDPLDRSPADATRAERHVDRLVLLELRARRLHRHALDTWGETHGLARHDLAAGGRPRWRTEPPPP